MLIMIKDGKGSKQDADGGSVGTSVCGFSKLLEDRRISFESQELCSVEAANALMSKLRFQLEPFRVIADETSPWEEKSAAVRLANKIHKSKRNKRWRKKKRKHIAEMLAKVVIARFVLMCCGPIPCLFSTLICKSFLFCLLTFLIMSFRSVSDLTKLIKKLMSGGFVRLPRILPNERYHNYNVFSV